MYENWDRSTNEYKRVSKDLRGIGKDKCLKNWIIECLENREIWQNEYMEINVKTRKWVFREET